MVLFRSPIIVNKEYCSFGLNRNYLTKGRVKWLSLCIQKITYHFNSISNVHLTSKNRNDDEEKPNDNNEESNDPNGDITILSRPQQPTQSTQLSNHRNVPDLFAQSTTPTNPPMHNSNHPTISQPKIPSKIQKFKKHSKKHVFISQLISYGGSPHIPRCNSPSVIVKSDTGCTNNSGDANHGNNSLISNNNFDKNHNSNKKLYDAKKCTILLYKKHQSSNGSDNTFNGKIANDHQN